MDQNFNNQPNQPYNQPNQPYGQPNQPYGQPNQPYGQQPYMNNGYQPPHGLVKDLFCNILLVIMPLRMLIAIISYVVTFASVKNVDYYSVMDGSYLTSITSSPGYTLLSLLSNVLLVANIVLVILDVIEINKANYKVTGLVLFAIFLNYGYYIWRAYILGRAKKFPIIYTVCYALLGVANVIVSVVYTTNMTLNMMSTMY